jgi:uncharacterized RDD family membrane protein YckC
VSIVKLDTGFNIEIDFVITPFHKRMFAWAIDIVVIFVYIWLIEKIIGVINNNRAVNLPGWISVFIELPIIFYHLIFEVTMNGQSIGKKAMNIQVISLDGGQPTISQYLIRWMFRSIDFPIIILAAVIYRELPWWCMILLFAGIGCVIVTPNSQRLGDLVAGTIIIDKKTRTSWQDTVFTELETGYQPRYAQVMRLSDKDVNTLKSIIDSVKKSGNYDLSMRIADRIRSRLDVQSDQDSLDFLETLLKDYNYYTTA